jgi:hypothetical protein
VGRGGSDPRLEFGRQRCEGVKCKD